MSQEIILLSFNVAAGLLSGAIFCHDYIFVTETHLLSHEEVLCFWECLLLFFLIFRILQLFKTSQQIVSSLIEFVTWQY